MAPYYPRWRERTRKHVSKIEKQRNGISCVVIFSNYDDDVLMKLYHTGFSPKDAARQLYQARRVRWS